MSRDVFIHMTLKLEGFLAFWVWTQEASDLKMRVHVLLYIVFICKFFSALRTLIFKYSHLCERSLHVDFYAISISIISKIISHSLRNHTEILLLLNVLLSNGSSNFPSEKIFSCSLDRRSNTVDSALVLQHMHLVETVKREEEVCKIMVRKSGRNSL